MGTQRRQQQEVAPTAGPPGRGDRPNVVVCLMDDLGFSDLGCYGSEIATPTIDGLARSGLRFTQAYNSARCCPSRAALLTGLHPQQAGVGHMVGAGPSEAYAGYMTDAVPTIAELLRDSGYETMMSGKWHVGGDYDSRPPSKWRPGERGFPTPLQRGFERFFGTLTGAGSYYQPSTLMRQDTFVAQEDPSWYYTDAIAGEACAMLRRRDRGRPFFLYLAFTAPHWPLHARWELAEPYLAGYRRGWDVLRGERHERMQAEGLVEPGWRLSARDPDAWAWEESVSQEWEAQRMAVYAAQVAGLDSALGRVLRVIDDQGESEDTLVIVCSDNGGCPELLREDAVPDGTWPSSVPLLTFGERPVAVGNRVGTTPGGPDTFMSYDLCWANLSNTPLRRFKRWVHEGGISTPLVVRWPQRIAAAGVVRTPVHIFDIAPTVLEAARVAYPGDWAGTPTPALAGQSFIPSFADPAWCAERRLYFEHEGHRAVRDGDWKLVSVRFGDWELYNLEQDRTETVDLAGREAERASALEREWFAWADSVGADPAVFADAGLIESRYVSIDPVLRSRYRRGEV